MAGAPPPTRTIERVETELGWEFIQIYGLTETTPLLTMNRGRAEYDDLTPAERAERLGRAGAPVLGIQMAVDDQGELLARGNHVMDGYWEQPEATADAIVDGWFHTGDGGIIDEDNYVAISDRKKDVIISGGENVSSIEVEDALFSHAAVAEVAVIGVPDEKWGETVKALVVLARRRRGRRGRPHRPLPGPPGPLQVPDLGRVPGRTGPDGDRQAAEVQAPSAVLGGPDEAGGLMGAPFVLVHGAWHGGACWRPLIDELEGRGERAIAVDLPCEDPDATLEDYAQAVVDAASVFDEPVVVVGHSLAGLTIPLIPSRRPVAGLVFVAAILPEPGRTPGEVLGPEAFSEGFGELSVAQIAEDNGASSWTRDAAIAAFYHDVPEPEVTEAVAALRPQQFGPTLEDWPIAAYPDVPMRYVACDDDRILDPGWQVRSARERLGLEADVLSGSHSPMLSRPADLADLLVAPFS